MTDRPINGTANFRLQIADCKLNDDLQSAICNLKSEISIAPDGRPAAEQPAWRRDFPIDWPRDHYVSRRDFTKFLGLTSLAFVIGQAWIGVKSVRDRLRGRPPESPVARLDEVPVGSARSFQYPTADDPCLLLRPDDRTLVAYSQKCTHLSCAVVPEVENGRLVCPCHKGYFDLATGRPLAGPPRRPLPRVALQVRDGVVYATGVEAEK
jgi:nitrite reductase/ring-hydroxylating ferredoxin subunit